MSPVTLGAALAAGVLTVLSPCVLPILPIVFGSANSRGRLGPVVLALGVATGFTAVGLFVATVGFSLGFDQSAFHRVAGALLLVFGMILLSAKLQTVLEHILAPVSNWASRHTGNINAGSVFGQALLGVLLGAVWSPCVGPTLGAASLLASQGKDLGSAAATMIVFGIGAAIPLLVLGQASRASVSRFRGRLSGTGRIGKLVLGGGMLTAGALVVTGADKSLEAILVSASPEWLIALTSSI